MFNIVFKSILVFLCTASLYATAPQDYDFVTEVFPPYNFKDKNGLATGMNTDLLVHVFKVAGVNKTAADIQVWPWARGYRQVQEDDAPIALFSTTRTEKREHLFRWVGPLSTSNNSIMVKKGNPKKINIDDDGDFVKYNLVFGAIRDDLGHQTLIKNGVPEDKIALSANLDSLLKMLSSGRVDAISYNRDVFAWLAKQEGFTDYEVVYAKELGRHYIAFPRSTPDSVIEFYQENLDKVRNNKELFDSFKRPYQG